MGEEDILRSIINIIILGANLSGHSADGGEVIFFFPSCKISTVTLNVARRRRIVYRRRPKFRNPCHPEYWDTIRETGVEIAPATNSKRRWRCIGYARPVWCPRTVSFCTWRGGAEREPNAAEKARPTCDDRGVRAHVSFIRMHAFFLLTRLLSFADLSHGPSDPRFLRAIRAKSHSRSLHAQNVSSLRRAKL